MATASIFRTPTFETERAIDSLIRAIASSESAAREVPPSFERPTVREVRDRSELERLMGEPHR